MPAVMLAIGGVGVDCKAQARGRPVGSSSNSQAEDASHTVSSLRRYSDTHPEDPQGWIALGRAIIEQRTTSNTPRIEAIAAFRHATSLAPASPDAWDGLARAGMLIGGADGEDIAQDALGHLLALNPAYDDAWGRWMVLHRDRGDRDRMRGILAAHDANPEVRSWIASLLIEDERYDQADSLLDELVERDTSNSCWLALRAQSAFEAGDTMSGAALYARALARSDQGSRCLWSQVVGIANPDEIRAWPTLAPSERRLFLLQFWARRNPDLFAGANVRIAEHFARLRLARKRYTLLHPLQAYQRSQEGRALEAAPSIAEQIFYQRCEARVYRGAPVHAADASRSLGGIPTFSGGWSPRGSSRDAIQPPGTLFIDPEITVLVSIPHSRDIRDVDATAARVGYNLATGLDDRGVAYLRYGEPKRRTVGSENLEDQFCRIPDVERWEYEDIGTIRFFRPNAVFVGLQGGVRQTGDMVFRPMGSGQFEAMAAALTTDGSSVAAPLSFGFWTVQFRGKGRATDVLVVITRGEAAVSLVGGLADSTVVARDSSGRVWLSVASGNYSLLVNARDAEVLGRQIAGLQVRAFAGQALSDLLLAPAWDGPHGTRDTMVAHVPRDLTFEVAARLRCYAELYGLPVNDGSVRYQAIYQVARTRDAASDVRRDSLANAQTYSFLRELPAAPNAPLVESLDISPENLAPGTYLLRLDITDAADGHRIGRAQVAFTIRSVER